MKTKETEALELNQARSKPDTVDQPVRTARTFVHHYNSTQYCNTETVLLTSPSSRPTSHLRCGQLEVRGGELAYEYATHDEMEVYGCKVILTL